MVLADRPKRRAPPEIGLSRPAASVDSFDHGAEDFPGGEVVRGTEPAVSDEILRGYDVPHLLAASAERRGVAAGRRLDHQVARRSALLRSYSMRTAHRASLGCSEAPLDRPPVSFASRMTRRDTIQQGTAQGRNGCRMRRHPQGERWSRSENRLRRAGLGRWSSPVTSWAARGSWELPGLSKRREMAGTNRRSRRACACAWPAGSLSSDGGPSRGSARDCPIGSPAPHMIQTAATPLGPAGIFPNHSVGPLWGPPSKARRHDARPPQRANHRAACGHPGVRSPTDAPPFCASIGGRR